MASRCNPALLLVALALLHGHALASPETCPGGVCAWSAGPIVKCMELSAKCGPATQAAYDSQDITSLLQCASLSDLCACAEADLFPQDVGAFVSAVCSTTANIASVLSSGASHTEAAPHAISTVYHGDVNVTRHSPGKLRLGAGGSGSLGCIVPPYGRGVGSIPGTCPAGTEKNGLLCYPKCRAGYTGVAHICWQDCSVAGFKDIGAFCQKSQDPYHRGSGYPWTTLVDGLSLDDAATRCLNENPRLGCETSGANGGIVFPKCRAGYHSWATFFCSPDCPIKMTDTGTGCAKDSYTRGLGDKMVCSAGQEMNAGLCYRPCRAGYTGVGPVCWPTTCPAQASFKCSPFCATSKANCDAATSKLMKQGLNLAKVAGKLATCITSAGLNFESCLGTVLGVGDLLIYVKDNFPTC